MRIIWKFMKDTIKLSPVFFILNIVFIFLYRILQLGMDLSLKFATDAILDAQSIQDIILPFVLFFVAMMLGGNTGNINNLVVTLFTRNSSKIFTKRFMRHSYEQKQDSFYDGSFYNEYEFIKNNIPNTSQISVTVFNTLLSSLFSLVITISAITYFSPLILVVILPISVSMVLINRYITNKRIKLDQKYINEERKAAYFSDLLSNRVNAKEIRIFHLNDTIWEKWHTNFEKYAEAKYQFEKKARWLSSVPMLLENLLSGGLILLFLFQTSEGSLSVGNFVLMYRMMWRLTGGISMILQTISSNLLQNYRYVERYEHFVGRPQEIPPQEICLPFGEFQELTLKNVTYSYPSQQGTAVENVNFKLRKGEIVAILGYNGSGKSTLSKIMCGLLEDYEGTITLNGNECAEAGLPLYQYFGIAFQDFTRYSLSLKDNISIGMIERKEDDQAVRDALELGNLQEIIDFLPHGIDTVLGKEYDSEGQDLSGGQWQRIILSRAHMGDPPILILDEPTASIDPLQEMKMLENFRTLIHGKTAVLISHRIGFARLSDRICMMDHGKIVEEGTHEELIDQKGFYYELYMSQKDLYGEIK